MTAGTTGLPNPADGGTWAIDLDGVIWLTGQPIAGSAEAVARLRDAGARVLFASNNSAPTLDVLLGRLERAGIPMTPDDLVTSAQAAASMIEPGARVMVMADGGVPEAMAARGLRVTTEGDVDVVVVGWTHNLDFDRLAAAARAIRGGARFIGTNDDPSHPTPAGLLPGTGAILAFVATAAGVQPEIAGKPYPPLSALVAERADNVTVVVGDRASTDGMLARHLDVPFALVLSGVTGPGQSTPIEVPADFVGDDLAAVVDAALG